MSRNRFFASVLFLFILFAGMSGCDDDSDSEFNEDPVPDDDGDDDASDDDASDDDHQDDDAADDDDDNDDDDSLPFPELDPQACALEKPVDLLGFDPAYALARSGNWVWDKNYYLLTLLSEVSEAAEAIQNDVDLAAVSAQRDNLFRQGLSDCDDDISCWENHLLWSQNDADDAAAALSGAFSTGRAFDLAGEHLLPSGEFNLHADASDDALLEAAWLDAVWGMHQAFASYAAGLPPDQLDVIAAQIDNAHPDPMPFFQPLLEVALAAMDYYGRDEAGRYEPMDEDENQAAVEKIQTIDWNDYRFSIILVPGRGPETEIPLHPTGKIRCDMAARRYQAGLAPLIVVSGGHVHPDGTQYCEAMEMKRYLMNRHGILEEAILVDPHARHTTTNLRNVARLVFRYGIPPEKPALVTTDYFQNFYIDFLIRSRCLEELGYVPWRKLARLGGSDTCLLVHPLSLYVDSRDPLDP